MPRLAFRTFLLSLLCGLIVSTGWDLLRTIRDPDLPLWTDFVCLGVVFVVAYVVLDRRAAPTPTK